MFKVLNKTFTHKNKALNYVRSYLLSRMNSTISPKHNDFDAFMSLLSGHPNKQEKLKQGIKAFLVVPNDFNSSLVETRILTESDKVIDFSWRKCVEHRSNKTLDYLYSAFRNSINDTTKGFKTAVYETGVPRCKDCLTPVEKSKAEVSHDNHFSHVIHEFLKLNPTHPIEFKDTLGNKSEFMDADIDYKNKWIDFHKEYAVLAIRCARCNRKRRRWYPNADNKAQYQKMLGSDKEVKEYAAAVRAYEQGRKIGGKKWF